MLSFYANAYRRNQDSQCVICWFLKNVSPLTGLFRLHEAHWLTTLQAMFYEWMKQACAALERFSVGKFQTSSESVITFFLGSHAVLVAYIPYWNVCDVDHSIICFSDKYALCPDRLILPNLWTVYKIYDSRMFLSIVSTTPYLHYIYLCLWYMEVHWMISTWHVIKALSLSTWSLDRGLQISIDGIGRGLRKPVISQVKMPLTCRNLSDPDILLKVAWAIVCLRWIPDIYLMPKYP